MCSCRLCDAAAAVVVVFCCSRSYSFVALCIAFTVANVHTTISPKRWRKCSLQKGYWSLLCVTFVVPIHMKWMAHICSARLAYIATNVLLFWMRLDVCTVRTSIYTSIYLYMVVGRFYRIVASFIKSVLVAAFSLDINFTINSNEVSTVYPPSHNLWFIFHKKNSITFSLHN